MVLRNVFFVFVLVLYGFDQPLEIKLSSVTLKCNKYFSEKNKLEL